MLQYKSSATITFRNNGVGLNNGGNEIWNANSIEMRKINRYETLKALHAPDINCSRSF